MDHVRQTFHNFWGHDSYYLKSHPQRTWRSLTPQAGWSSSTLGHPEVLVEGTYEDDSYPLWGHGGKGHSETGTVQGIKCCTGKCPVDSSVFLTGSQTFAFPLPEHLFLGPRSICTEVTQKQFLPFFVIWAVSSDLFLPFQMSSCWLQQLKIWILLSFHLSFKQNTSPCIWRKSEWNLLGKEQSSMGDKHTDGHCRHKMMTVLRISYSSRSALPGRTCSILPFCYSLPSPS